MAQLGASFREKLMTTVTYVSLFYVICLCLYISAQRLGDSNDGVCKQNAFPCYQDCCLLDQSFCHHGQRRCVHCATREALCGRNESLPRDCRLYCYRLLNPPPVCDNDPDSVSRTTFLAVVIPLGTVVVSLIALLIAQCVYARVQPLDKWPGWLRVVLGLNARRYIFNHPVPNDKDPKATEENTPMLSPPDQTTRDFNAGRPPVDPHEGSSSPASRPPSSISDNNASLPNMEDLNLIHVGDGGSDDRPQTPGRSGSEDDPPPPATSSGGSPESGRAGSPGGTEQPSQGSELGGTHAEAAAGDQGRSPPPGAPRTSHGGQSLHQEGHDSATDTDTGRRPTGNNGRRPQMTSSEGMPHQHGPDPSGDFEVRPPASPNRASAPGQHLPAEGARNPGGCPATPHRGHELLPLGYQGHNVNEISAKPNFSMMPTTASVDNDGDYHAIVTNGSNPVAGYHAIARQHSPL